MFEKIRRRWKRHLIRPAVTMAFTRFVLALTAALLWANFVRLPGALSMRAMAFLFFGILFIALSWIAYLRLDGIRLPKIMMHRVNIRKKPTRTYGDMADYTNEPVISFEELEDDEKDLCCLFADAVCAALFLILSVF